ncbi:AAA family ATPase [Geomicrobium sp. JCM 19037]|uniref:AAA family ATPase n=1 Tax=Geomicrobium sp. JCM 19037 TaxID=1460634 RepID=UPI001EE66588|nr:AAA family ATPase [Geomicrobium sp. JCM 19037]
MYGEADRFCRIDMNTLSTEHYSAALTGAPPGYVGSKEGTTLFNKEYIEGTYSKPGIVLFDEIEKADHEVILTLLNVFDHGRLRVTSGQVDLDFTNTIVFMTSNLASKDILQHADQTSDEVKRIVQEKLEETFLPEFINRIDDILQFNRLETDVAKQIVNMYTADLNARLKRHNSSVSLEAPFVTRLIDEGYDAKYGARALKRSFRRSVEVPLAKRLVAGESGEFLGREREITIKNTSINQ